MDDLDLAIGNVVCKVSVGKLEPAREILLRKIARAEVHIFIVVVLLIGLGIKLGIVDRQDGFARKRLIDMNLAVATDIGRIDALRLGRSDLSCCRRASQNQERKPRSVSRPDRLCHDR